MNEADLDTRLLRSFVAVAEELHFGRAARRLHLSQPPLSVHVRRLEESLGARLFERSRRRVELTPAGTFFLARARYLLAEGERTRAEVARIARGEAQILTLGYAATATHEILPDLVPRLRAAHPGARLELVEMRSPAQPEALRTGRIDVGFVCAPVDKVGLLERPLVHETLVALLPARHPLAKRAFVDVRRLGREPFVFVDREVEPAWADASLAALRAAGVRPDVVQETDTKFALLGLVAAGLGVSVVSRSMTCLERAGVVYRRLRGVDVDLRLSAIARDPLSDRARAVLELLPAPRQ